MHLKIVLLVTCVWVCGVVVAQTDSTSQKTKKKSCSCSFSSINQAGIMRGEEGAYFQLQTINGMRYKTWFAGLGLGLDRYPVNGIPVFLDIRKYFKVHEEFHPFVYANGGVHIADIHNEETQWQRIDYSNGLYYDVGLGLRLPFNKKTGLLLSGGYSYKKYEKTLRYNVSGCTFFPCYESMERYTYTLNRLSLKIGVQL
jgi:hypothetical protein